MGDTALELIDKVAERENSMKHVNKPSAPVAAATDRSAERHKARLAALNYPFRFMLAHRSAGTG
jgi:hypothetical protein